MPVGRVVRGRARRGGSADRWPGCGIAGGPGTVRRRGWRRPWRWGRRWPARTRAVPRPGPATRGRGSAGRWRPGRSSTRRRATAGRSGMRPGSVPAGRRPGRAGGGRPGRFPRWRRGCGPAGRCAGDAQARAGQPGQDVTGSRSRARLPREDGQLDQRNQPPVRAGPLAVRVHPEPAVGCWPDSSAVTLAPAPRQHPDLPVHRGGRGGSSARWPARRCSAARLWRRASADPCPCRLRLRSPA